MGAVRSCLSRIGCLTLLVLATTVGWLYKGEIADWWLDRAAGGPGVTEPFAADSAGGRASPAAPDSAEARPSTPADAAARSDGRNPLEAFLSAPLPATFRLDARELARLVERRVAAGLPSGVANPAAVPEDSLLRVEADVDIRRLVGDRIPAMMRRMVGDSSRVRALVSPSVPRHGTLRLRVRELRAGSVGLPAMTYPWLLTEMGLPLAPDDPTAVDLPVGYDLASARVEDGALVIVRRAP